jgi:electron transport complex protein RnfB
VEGNLAERIDAVLPQTQCTRCGYDGCRPYADAVAARATDINRCPPGGAAVVAALAAITGRAVRPVDPDCGTFPGYRTARIDESYCIGCTLCIDACPVDAILGGPKQMHVVLPHLCSGCELCVAPCPVDCIVMDPADRAWSAADAAAARSRHRARSARRARDERIADRGAAVPTLDAAANRAATVAAALERARLRRAAVPPRST